MSSIGEAVPPVRDWRPVVVWAALPLLLAALNEYALFVALPNIGDEFGLDLSEIRWSLLVFLIADAAVLVVAGRYGDRVGRRRTSVIGLILIAAGSLVCVATPMFAVLLVGRVIEGIGMGVLFSGLLAIIADCVPRESFGRAFGVWAAVGAVAALVGPVLAGLLADYSSWRWIFVLNSVIAVAALIAARRVLLPQPAPGPLRPLQHAALLRIRSFVAGTAVGALVYLTRAMTWTVIVFYVVAVHNLGAATTGLVVAAYTVWWLVLPPLTGRLADRIGARRPMLWGSSVGFIGVIVLAFAANVESLSLLVLGLSLFGIGVAFTIPAANAVTMGSVPLEVRGDASGINMTVRVVGSILGFLLATTMLSSASRDDVLFGAPWAWGVAAGVMLLAGAVTATAVRPIAR